VLIDVGPVAVGGELSVPIGKHWDDSGDNTDNYLDYTAYDLNLMFTLSTAI